MPQVELRNVVVIALHCLRRIRFVVTIEQFVLVSYLLWRWS